MTRMKPQPLRITVDTVKLIVMTHWKDLTKQDVISFVTDHFVSASDVL